MTTEAKLVDVDFKRREPRCRICRDEALRVLVDSLLDWRGTPIPMGGRKCHVFSYADIMRALEPINAQRDEWEQVSYDSLRVHANRHYDFHAVAAYHLAQMLKELTKPLGNSKVPTRLA